MQSSPRDSPPRTAFRCSRSCQHRGRDHLGQPRRRLPHRGRKRSSLDGGRKGLKSPSAQACQQGEGGARTSGCELDMTAEEVAGSRRRWGRRRLKTGMEKAVVGNGPGRGRGRRRHWLRLGTGRWRSWSAEDGAVPSVECRNRRGRILGRGHVACLGMGTREPGRVVKERCVYFDFIFSFSSRNGIHVEWHLLIIHVK